MTGAAARPPWWRRARRAARSAALRLAARLVARLPLRAALALGALAGRLAWPLARRERPIMLANLALALPAATPRARRAVARASLVHLARGAAELLALERHGARLDAGVRFAPGAEELIRRAAARGRGVVVVAGHIGHWELTARGLARLVAPCAAVARRTRHPWLDRALERLRAQAGVETIWRDDPGAARRILRLLRRGGALGLLIDQDTRVQGVVVPFFGRPAFTPRAPADLALRFGAAVVVVTCRRLGARPGPCGAGHEISAAEVAFEPDPADREAEVTHITSEAVAIQERAIRENPAEWVWMHRRWRLEQPVSPQASAMPKSRELSEI